MISIRASIYLQALKKDVSDRTWISSQTIRLKNIIATMKFLIHVPATLQIETKKFDFNYGNYRDTLRNRPKSIKILEFHTHFCPLFSYPYAIEKHRGTKIKAQQNIFASTKA